MLDELDLDDLLPEDRCFGGTPNSKYRRTNYARLEGKVRRFRDLALDESISIDQVAELQRLLADALEYIDEREREERQRLLITTLEQRAKDPSSTPNERENAARMAAVKRGKR